MLKDKFGKEETGNVIEIITISITCHRPIVHYTLYSITLGEKSLQLHITITQCLPRINY